MAFSVLTINPGSTSTKLARFEGEGCVWQDVLRHTAEELAPFGTVSEQLDFRLGLVRSALAAHDGGAVRLVGARQDEVDLEGGVADAGADREPGRLQRSGDLTAVPTEHALRGRQSPRGPSLGGLVEVGAQVLDSSVGRALGVQVLGVEAGEDDDLPAGPGDGHVEAAFAAGVVEHPEVQRQITLRIGGEGR